MQCRAEIPHLKEIMPEYIEKDVKFVSVNTRNPKGQVDAEIKKYKMTYPVHYGKGQNINRDFKVKKLPRLIIIKNDKTVHLDKIFLKAEQIREHLDMLLGELESVEVKNTTGEEG